MRGWCCYRKMWHLETPTIHWPLSSTIFPCVVDQQAMHEDWQIGDDHNVENVRAVVREVNIVLVPVAY
jgi:hypothetical protein